MAKALPESSKSEVQNSEATSQNNEFHSLSSPLMAPSWQHGAGPSLLGLGRLKDSPIAQFHPGFAIGGHHADLPLGPVTSRLPLHLGLFLNLAQVGPPFQKLSADAA